MQLKVIHHPIRFFVNGTFQMCVVCVIVLSSWKAYSQQKFEKESGISRKDLPAFAVHFESIFVHDQKIRWYLEEGFNGSTIEAKYTRNKEKYSVEFDSLGTIQDVEILVKWSDLSTETQGNIEAQFLKDSDKYKLSKIQVQYTGEQIMLQNSALSGECSENCLIRYEVVVRIKKEGVGNSYEYLFDKNGKLIQKMEIVNQSSSNLEY